MNGVVRMVIWARIGSAAASRWGVVLGVALLTTSAHAGPVFLTGHDPDYHAQGSAGARNLLAAGLDFVTGGTYNGGQQKFLWVESRISPPLGHLVGEAGLATLGLQLGTHYDRADGAALASVDFSLYSAIVVASSYGGLLTRAELDALIARKADIEAFVNAGGGVFAMAECYPCGADLLGGDTDPDLFGYLPLNVVSVETNPPFTVTTSYGASLGLTDGDVNDPTHNSFQDAAGLNIVDVDQNDLPVTLAGVVSIVSNGDGGTGDGGGGSSFVLVPEAGAGWLAFAGLVAFALGAVGSRSAAKHA